MSKEANRPPTGHSLDPVSCGLGSNGLRLGDPHSQQPYRQEALFARDLAILAGQCIARHRTQNSFQLSYKNSRDALTTADLEADRIIVSGIQERFPQHQILSEESSPSLSKGELCRGPLWIIDPIDGTVNYASGQLHVAVSIAFMLDGVVRAGVVYAPFLGELYIATQGGGAQRNGLAIRPKPPCELVQAIIATGFPYQREDLTEALFRVEKVLRHAQDLRRLGAASLDVCWVACGRLDAYYESVAPWDIAAAGLIAREAGLRTGTTRDSDKNQNLPADLESDQFLTARPEMFEKIQSLLRG